MTFLTGVKGNATFISNQKYWPYAAEGCMNVRDTYLAKSSLTSKIGFTKRGKFDCHISFGRWKDYFTGETIRVAKELILAPAIPLQHLSRLLNNKWLLHKFHGYSHDEEIFITFKRGGEGEIKYLKNINSLSEGPIDFFNECELAGKWLDAKIRWNIPFLDGEKKQLVSKALQCITARFSRTKLYGGWGKTPGFKCNTRVEVLNRYSHVPTTPIKKYEHIKCTPKLRGEWNDPYSNIDYKVARVLDIDHIVPLRHAYQAGSWKWPYWKRRKYANYMMDPFHLIPVHFSENRRKSDNGPDNYMPPNESFRCEYIEMWIHTKLRWALKIEKEEMTFLRAEIEICESSINSEELNSAIDLLSAPIPW